MRHAAAFALMSLCALPVPALAWQAGTDGALCTLTHLESGREVFLTYDPAAPLYSITVTRPDPWPEEAIFAIRFAGGDTATISTDRHRLTSDGRSLTVVDRGFGNVLMGLSNNATMATLLRGAEEVFSLEGAAPQVEIFRNCSVAAFS